MLEYNEITERKYIILDGEPWEVLSSHVFRKQQRKPVNATKLRNMLSGRVTERSFHQSEKVEEADISTRKIKFLYQNKGEYWFCEEKDPSKRFELDEAILGVGVRFIKNNTLADALVFNDPDDAGDDAFDKRFERGYYLVWEFACYRRAFADWCNVRIFTVCSADPFFAIDGRDVVYYDPARGSFRNKD